MDFRQVFADKPVTVELPIDLVGRSPGVQAGGKLVQKARKMRVSGLFADLPERVSVDINNLNLARTIKAGDLRYDKFRVAMKPDVAIASCELTRALRQEAQQAAKTTGKK
jgi:large subunit ribosomal protein L25